MSEVYLGEIRMFSFENTPIWWQPCDGRLLNITEYDALYALIGTTYGGNGVTTFGLPDLRGRVPLHQGTGAGLTNRIIGERNGAEYVTLQTAQMPAHTHALVAVNEEATTRSPENAFPAAIAAPDTMYIAETANIPLNAETVGLVGAGQGHENRAPVLSVNFCICTMGTFPSRN